MRQILIAGILSAGLISNVSHADSWNGKIIEIRTRTQIPLEELSHRLASAKYVIMGEKHYTNEVQMAEGRIIETTASEAGMAGRFVTAWEFLNYTSQPQTSDAFARFVRGEISAIDFLRTTQGNHVSDGYSAMLESTKALKGSLIGVNLSREEKAPVVQKGIAAVDPKLLPPGFEMGGANYHERFVAAMSGGHATPEQMERFFEAQCLTDDFMAFHLAEDTASALKFMVVGSFHTDYLDGFVARLKVRAGKDPVATVKIVDASDFHASELLESLHDPKYGDIADYAWVVNEPQP